MTDVSPQTASSQRSKSLRVLRGSVVAFFAAALAAPGFLSVPLSAASPSLPIPARSPSALTGSAFYAEIQNATQSVRETRVRQEVLAGNIPDFLRTWKEVPGTLTSGQVATLMVSADYLAIGSDADFFRMPISGTLADQLVIDLGLLLPTRPVVDNIHATAQVKFAPTPFTPDATMTTAPIFYASHQAIQTQFANANKTPGLLVSGIKKDIIYLPQAYTLTPTRVAIYGWHQLNNVAIQPPSTVHHAGYVDYSHGFRLVAKRALVNGVWTDLSQSDLALTGPIISSIEAQESAEAAAEAEIQLEAE